MVAPADRPDAPRHHEARDRGAAEPVAGGADVAVRAAEQRPPLGAGEEQRAPSTRLTRVEQEGEVLGGRAGVAQLEPHGPADLHDVADDQRAGRLVGVEDAADEEVVPRVLVDVLVDDDAEVQPTGRRAAARERVRAHHLGQPHQRRRSGQLVEHVALRAGDRHRRPGRAAALAHRRCDGDVSADEQPDRAVGVHLAVEEQPVRPGAAARAGQAAHHRQRAGVRQETGERERVRVDEQHRGPLVAVQSGQPAGVGPEGAQAGTGQGGRPHRHGRAAVHGTPVAADAGGGGADRHPRAGRGHHLPRSRLDQPASGGDAGRDEDAQEVRGGTGERCQRLGQRDLRGALEVRSDREAVPEPAGPAGRRRVRRGRVGQGGNRHARHQASRRFTGHAHPPRLARDPASGRCRRSHGVHTRQRGWETVRHPPCRPLILFPHVGEAARSAAERCGQRGSVTTRSSMCIPASTDRSRTSARPPGSRRSRARTTPDDVVTHRHT